VAAESSGRPFKNLGGGRIVKRKTDVEKIWSIRDIPVRFDWVKPAKEIRAKRRVENDTVEGGDGEWCVWGMPELSDSFEKYSVCKDLETGNLSCSCQSHAHGDARGFCSHQLAVALYEHGKDPYPRFEALDWSEVGGNGSDAVASADSEPTAPYNHEEEMRSIIKEISVSVSEPSPLWSVEGVVEWKKTRAEAKELSSVPACASAMSLVEEFVQSVREAPEHEEAQSSQFWYDYEKTPTILTLTEIAPNRWSLPDKFSEIRPNQLIGLKQIVAQWHDRKKFILVDAPTGSGKTALGIISAMEISGFADGNKKVESLYICTDRALQDQFWDDFEFCLWSAILKGRRNYPTANYASKWQEENPSQTQWEREQVVSCEDCEYSQKKHCSLCDPRGYTHSEGESPGRGGAPCLGRCPYRQAVRKLVHSDVGNMNTAYLLRACSGPSWGQYNKKKVLIVDEADCLESAIMGYVEISVSEFKLRRLGMGRPKKKTVVSSWIEWAEEAINKIGFILDLRSRQLDNPTDKSLFGEDEKLFGNDKLLRRDANSWIGLCDQLQLMHRSLQGGKDPWVYDTDENKEGEEIGPVVFKPVVISAFVENMLWKHFDFVMLMSATLICPFQTAEDLGIPAGNFGAVCLPSSFDPRRSPVYVYPVADNSFKMQEQNYPILLGEIIKAVNLRPKVRILIHAVSYKQADKLVRDLNRLVKGRAVIGHERGVASKNKAKAEYRLRPNSIMVSPSMARGENLYDDLLRFQIIMKMPFGNLGDKQISQRLYGTTGGKRWYLINTIRETVQMEGRGMRHANDWAETLILDAKFISVWQEGAELFPKYFRDRMVFIQEGKLVEYMQNGFGEQFV
jgi:Rad3-related DNA helicase